MNATIETLEDGTAKDTFWLTDRTNKKVSAICSRLPRQIVIEFQYADMMGTTNTMQVTFVKTERRILHGENMPRYTITPATPPMTRTQSARALSMA